MSHSDDESLDKLKYWWKTYGTQAMFVVAIVLFAFAGWRYWQNTQASDAAAAQALSQKMQLAAQQAAIDPSNAENNTEVQRLGEQLMNDYRSTPYAQDAALLLAKHAVDKKDFARAKTLLQGVIDADADELETALATTRLARIELQLGHVDAALALLATIKSAGLVSLVEELRGDAYLQKGDRDNAAKAYLAADADLAKRQQQHPTLALKMSSLGLVPAERNGALLEDRP